MVEIFKTDVYDRWFHTLKDKKTQAILDMHIERMRFGNFGNSKPIGQGLSELKINYGAGNFAQCIRVPAGVLQPKKIRCSCLIMCKTLSNFQCFSLRRGRGDPHPHE